MEVLKDLKGQYEKLISERNGVIEQINALAADEKVKRYLELCSQNVTLEEQQKSLYRKMKFKEYSSCNHIWVNSLYDYDSCTGRTHNYHGCIKCGLDQGVRALVTTRDSLKRLRFEQRVMYDYMCGHFYRTGIDIRVFCDLDLAKAIYSKIKEAHPYIDDETAIKYFEIALNDMREIKVSDERKVGRANRLSLNPKFNKWNSFDVRRF